ncbi:MAG: starvation/stationary phase protection protein Dps [Rariglobus sp.]|jgi:starvation-inducible DNA-binding protein|nr:starvation/stationary phase protection protein Dps [Rariglobus sp.]
MKTPATPRTQAVRPLLWNTHHDQPEARRIAVVALLNAQLADVLDLGLQAKQAHWNVKGPQFAALHGLFDDVAEALDEFADDLAERAVQLGGVARGTLQVLARESRLEAYPLDAFAGAEHLWALSAALARFAHTAREAIHAAEKTGDAGTVDVLTEVSRGVDTLLWKVEAHVALEPRWVPGT